MLRDDGVVIYINEVEVYRSNMPAGTISYTTLAPTAASDDGETPQVFNISPSAFVSGNIVIAVEMHQNAANSSDLSFDLQLIGTVPGAALIAKWFPIFFIPGLVLLPLSPPIGGPSEVSVLYLFLVSFLKKKHTKSQCFFITI